MLTKRIVSSLRTVRLGARRRQGWRKAGQRWAAGAPVPRSGNGRALPPSLPDRSAQLWDSQRGEVARSLLTSGVRCFASSGYHATTTRDITAAVGLSPGALYVHFRSKEHLLFEIIRTGHVRSLETLREADADGDAASCLRSLVARFVAWHAHHHVAARVSQYELGALAPGHYAETREQARRPTEFSRRPGTAGSAGERSAAATVHRALPAMPSLPADLVRWYRTGGPDSPEQLGD